MERNSMRQVDSCIQQAKKGVGEALKLDSQGKKKNAYLQYLRCVQFIADSLLKDADNTGGRDLNTSNTRKMTKLCQQCVDRAADLLTEIDDSEEIVIDFRRPITEASIPRHKTPGVAPHLAHPQGNVPIFPNVPTSTHQSLHPGILNQPAQPQTAPSLHLIQTQSSTRRNEPSPTEIAYRKNQQLLAGFKARMSRSRNEKHRSMLSLKLQRQLLENMSIARAQEAAITKKIQERHMMLMEEASRRFSTTGEPTADELERQQVYAGVLEYEHQTIWLKSWRDKLTESPQDLDLINSLISKILACEDHPLTLLLHKYQLAILHKVKPLIEEASHVLCAITIPYKGTIKLHFTEGQQKPRGDSFSKLVKQETVLQDELSQRLSLLRGPKEMLPQDVTTSQQSDVDSFLEEEDMFNDFDDDELYNYTLSDMSSDENQRLSKDSGNASHPNSATNASAEDVKHVLDKVIDNVEYNLTEENDRTENNGVNISDEEQTGNDDSGVDTSKEEGDEEPRDVMTNMVELVSDSIDEASEEVEEEKVNLEAAIVRDLEIARIGINVDARMMTESDLDGDSRDEEEYKNINVDSNDNVTEKCDGKNEATTEPSEIETTIEHGKSETTQHMDKDEHTPSKEQPINDNDNKDEEGGQNAEDKIKKLTEEAYTTHLKAIIKDTHMYIEKLVSMFVAVYEELNSRSARERCMLLIEDPFFQEIWPMLLKLFRISNVSKETSAAIAMTRYQDALPEHVGVEKKFCLTNEVAMNSSDSFPYKRAVVELCKVTTFKNPLSKLECIVRASRHVVRCVEEHYDSIGKQGHRIGNAIGCDDLLPILSYILVKTACPQIVSECTAMEEFIHEGYLFGEEGYCLTSLQTALGYVLRTFSTA